MEERLLNEFKQLIGDLNEIIIFKIDDDDSRDEAKRIIKNLEELIKKLKG